MEQRTAAEYLKILVEDLHRSIVATVDDEGLPVTAAIDLMDWDDNSIYFLTATGKNFYDRLQNRKFLALTAMKGEDTMSTVAISLRGKVRDIGKDRIPEIFAKNPYMWDIYPAGTEHALTVFQVYEGSGEWFDLSKKPLERASFTFRDEAAALEEGSVGDSPVAAPSGYRISERCIGCRSCVDVCPQQCILTFGVPFIIAQENCERCGNCMQACPVGAVVRLQ